ncbi:hypothetical protein OCU04_004960 [Sclerotinia nivalis]|uniref:2EXR domain-containing protein n=1 Tax=Sclerotinia nivalis TaxID=352851 RepID=A0A9X0AN47_9HELO|nr:hypothetical protein OCU04_004960 [Sclerotinia nivalis]
MDDFDQVVLLTGSEQKDISTSNSQQQDRENNEQNHSTINISQAQQPEDLLKIDAGIVNTKHNIVAINNVRESFSEFGKLPTELRLKIWKFAALQPRIIHVTPYKDESDELYFLCVTSQQCPLTMACQESREMVLSFKEPLELFKWGPEFKERINYLGPVPQNLKAFIYTNINIDTIWVHTFKDDWVTVSEAIVAIGWIPEVKRIIVPKANPMGIQMLSSIMPSKQNRGNSIIYSWALSFDLEEIYYLLGDENFSFDDKGIELPHLLDGYINNAYPRMFVAKRMPRSLEEIDEGHEKGFNDARNRDIEQLRGFDPIITEKFDDKCLTLEIKRLQAWKPPKIKYIKESQIDALLG